uniref:Uncharacterized protein n=1 Tax=Arundo donax TaxID=35708 RepID=A0A0A8ZUI8_ARUDO
MISGRTVGSRILPKEFLEHSMLEVFFSFKSRILQQF